MDDGLDSTVFVLNHHEAMKLINIPCEEVMKSQEVITFEVMSSCQTYFQ